MREQFHEELAGLSERMVEMTRLVGSAVGRATTALLDADLTLAESVIGADEQVDALQIDLEGADLDTITWCGRTLYANPYRGTRLSDEEIAVADLLERTLRWRRRETAPPYPLAQGCQDQLLSLAIGEAAVTGLPVTTRAEPWAPGLAGG